MKLAVTDRSTLMLSPHGLPWPAQAPDQRSKTTPDPEAGSAPLVRNGSVSEQSVPQSMPAGPERTVPWPLPAIDTDKVAPGANTAVTDLALSIVTVHVRFGPEQAPLQKLKSDPADGVAVNVTTGPPGKALVQRVPQEIPAGADVMEPLPAPARPTVNVIGTSKIAVTERLKSMVIVQGLL